MHEKRSLLVTWHPTAHNILASAGADNMIFIWKVDSAEGKRVSTSKTNSCLSTESNRLSYWFASVILMELWRFTFCHYLQGTCLIYLLRIFFLMFNYNFNSSKKKLSTNDKGQITSCGWPPNGQSNCREEEGPRGNENFKMRFPQIRKSFHSWFLEAMRSTVCPVGSCKFWLLVFLKTSSMKLNWFMLFSLRFSLKLL